MYAIYKALIVTRKKNCPEPAATSLWKSNLVLVEGFKNESLDGSSVLPEDPCLLQSFRGAFL